MKHINRLLCLAYCNDIFHKSPHISTVLVFTMPSNRQGNQNSSIAPGSASTNVSAVRAARFGLAFGHVDTALALVIAEEEVEGASSITCLSLEHIVLQLSSLPQGCTRAAGTLEVFFDFVILLGDVRMGWSPSAVGQHWRDFLVYLANRVTKQLQVLWFHLWPEKWWWLYFWSQAIQAFDVPYLISKLCFCIFLGPCNSLSIPELFSLSSGCTWD